MTEGTGSITLSLDQVVQIISQAKSAGNDPMSLGIQIFNGLGDNVTLPGSTLTLALTASAVTIPGPLVPLANAIQTVSKTGDRITIVLNQRIETAFNNAEIRFDEEVNFDVSATGNPALNNIAGVSAHAFLAWLNIGSVRLPANLDSQGLRV
jgi:hypothetical protein